MRQRILMFPLLLIVLLVGITFMAHSQRKLEIDSAKYDYFQTRNLRKDQLVSDKSLVAAFARRHGFLHPDNPNPNPAETFLLHDLGPNGHPQFIRPLELRSNRVHRSNQVQPLGTAALRLDGRGQTVGVFDFGRIQLEHQEFQSRVRMVDNVPNNELHSTHVSGIIAAAGINPLAKGMAPASRIDGYTFEAFDRKLVSASENGMALSNHSYGLSTGWIRDDNFPLRWRWYGDTTVSRTVDYSFGFYNNFAQFYDALSYFFPYHLLVKAAGNARNINGPASPFTHEVNRNGAWVRSTTRRDPNGNYDTTPGDATSKNVLTIGAINGTSDTDFSMASFSSWGPTDDGRVKPDLVGIGVNVLSTIANSSNQTNRYGTLQGTSMAAPNITGGITLLRQHFMQQHFYIPLASTLKALAIHSARHLGGSFEGPNYRFGWGLMDVEAAANHITLLDSASIIVLEDLMESGETYETRIHSDGSHPIKVTLVWTDLPGDIPAPSLNPRDTILVNDLDLVLIDPDGKEHFPWILDVENPERDPERGINSVDNVEQVVILEPMAGSYTIRITHKRAELEEDFQIFSLVGHATPLVSEVENLFWRGESGDWNDPNNWSNAANGEPIGRIPTAMDVVRFTNNFSTAGSKEITFSEDAVCLDFIFEADSTVIFRTQNQTLQISGSMYLEKRAVFEEGTIKMQGDRLRNNGLRNRLSDLSKIDLIIASNEALYEVEDTLIVNSLKVENGLLNLSNKYVETNQLIVGGSEKPYGLNIQGSTIKLSESLQIDTLGLEVFLANRSRIIFQNPTQSVFKLTAPGIILNEVEVQGGDLNLGEQVAIRKLSIAQDLTLNLLGDVLFDSLILSNQTNILFESNVELATSYLLGTAGSLNGLNFLGKEGAEGALNLLLPLKLCLNAAKVSHVVAIGEGSANAGLDGVLEGNTSGWFNTSCDAVLFAEFSIVEPCVDGLTLFVNNSTGEIDSFTWIVTDSLGTEVLRFEEESPSFTFDTTGTFEVELIITGGSLSRRNFGRLQIIENPLASLTIFKDRDDLVANLANINYQWFKDGELIPEANGRFFTPLGPGDYQVLGNNGQCSFLSDVFVVDSVVGIEDDFARFGIAVYPNPMEEVLHVSLLSDYQGNVRISMHDLRGAALILDEFVKEAILAERSILTSTLPSGIYILRIETNGQKVSRRMLKK